MAWSYRVVRTSMPDGGVRYAIHDVIYGTSEDIDNQLAISEAEKLGISWTFDPVGPEFYIDPGEPDDPDAAVHALREDLMAMFKVTTWPTVNGDSEDGFPLLEAVALKD